MTKLDRLALSMRALMDIVARIEAKVASLRMLSMNLDTSSATGKLMMNVLDSVAEFERSIMLERQREGIAKRAEVMALLAEGVSQSDVARRLGIGRSSVLKIIADVKVA